MPVEGLSINLATVRQQWDMRQAVDACLAQGITAIAPWRDQVAKIGLDAFITKGEAIARVTAMVAAKRASLLKQLANLDALDPVAMVNAAGTEKPPPQ